MSDDWEPVQQPAGDDWESVSLKERPSPDVGEALPEAFLSRLKAGQALGRVLSAAGKGAVEGAGQGTPTGFEDETLNHLIDLGIFHDPAKGRPGPLQMANEAVMIPAAKIWDTITRATAGGIHGAGGAVEQIVNEFGGSQGQANRAKNEIINLGNWAMIEAGMGRFSRPGVEPTGVADRQVGGLPTPQDFTSAVNVLTEPKSGLTLREAPEGGVYTPDQIKTAKGEKYFKVYDSNGDVKAEALIRVDGNTANIEDILAPGKPREEGRGALGTSDLRSVLRQFQAQHPEIEKITGERVSGASMEGGYSLLGERRQVEMNLRRMWQEDGIHPAEAVHDAQTDGFLKHEITAPREEIKPDPETERVLEGTGGKPGSLSAAVTDPADIPLDVQPPQPAGSLIATAQKAADTLFDVGRDIQMKLAPMARGSVESMSTVKDYMNAMRRNAWDASRIDTDLMKKFTPEQRTRMWNAMDEESLSLRLGEPESARQHQGLATLTPEERAAVVELDTRQQLAWLRARDLGMVEGEGIAMHAPRMVINAGKLTDREGTMPLNAMGYDLRTRTPGMRQRKYMEVEETERAAKAKYGEQATVARDIRTVNIGTSQLEDAVAGRTLIENIKEVGKRTGDETVAEGFKPDKTWFTIDHPAFKTYRPKFEEVDGKVQAIKDSAGNTVFEQVPIYVHGDFEGPLRAAMWGKTGAAYKGLMALKGKTMGLIMNSPAIHNLVEFGRAMPAMPIRMMTPVVGDGGVLSPVRIKVYADGFRAKNDPGVMHEAIDAGLVPIGKRFFNQDINAVMEAPDLAPGRSITAKLAAAVPGLFDEAAGTAVKQAVDKLGDFWHNRLLWDKIADLQAGLYVNIRGDLIGKGMDRQTASRVAAHYANRYAGALPKEAMSEMATKVSNFALFSRSFTLGNLGVMKDMLTGLPKDVLAQIERDVGFKAGSIEGAGEEGAVQQAVTSAKSIARRKAISIVALDVGLMYAGNSMLQSAFHVMLGQGGWSQEGHEYLRRLRDVVNDGSAHPLSLLNPLWIAGVPGRLSSTAENEPGLQNRVMIGTAKDGTAIYARNPVGKIGDEFSGYFDGPLDMLRKKEGTIARPLLQIYSNDAGFGRKVYDPHAETLSERAGVIGAIAKHLMASQLPIGQISAFSDLVKGEGDKFVNLLQAFGPFAGVTFRKGAPGGPAVGELYDARSRHEFAVNQAMPDIKKQILRGDLDGAISRMTELDINQGLQRWYIKSTLNPATRLSPRAMRDFQLYSTDEQKARMGRARQAPPQP